MTNEECQKAMEEGTWLVFWGTFSLVKITSEIRNWRHSRCWQVEFGPDDGGYTATSYELRPATPQELLVME